MAKYTGRGKEELQGESMAFVLTREDPESMATVLKYLSAVPMPFHSVGPPGARGRNSRE